MADDPKSNLVALADATVAALTAAQTPPEGEEESFISPFAEAFTAARRFAPLTDLAEVKDGDSPLVYILPLADDEQRQGKPAPAFRGDYEVAVIIYARVGVGDAAETRVEELMLLRGQIREYFKNGVARKLTVAGTTDTFAVLTGIGGNPAYAENILVEQHCFGSAQSLRFALMV
jgi:hypothetical protein